MSEEEKKHLKEKVIQIVGAQYMRVSGAMAAYYSDAPEIESTQEDWELWLEGLQEPMKSGFTKDGFEQSKTAIPFRRFYLERNDLGMRDYLRAHLNREDFEYYLTLEKED